MNNYGEELGYWYLRLNGFFPISDFVVHRDRVRNEDGFGSDRDCDLLGVRPRYVYESVGGQHYDWDESLTNAFDFGLDLGVICEVKTGAFNAANIFSQHAITTAIPRLGLAPERRWNQISETLTTDKSWENGGYQIKKILISHREVEGPWLHISLRHVVSFIMTRFASYRQEKFSARMFFSSSLIQFLADDRF